ncbi:MAG: hypothetical protein WCD72_02360 [Dehalococcoidia bacterium]
MKKDKSTEKQFLEYLDRLLAGEEISPGDEVSDDLRSALEHARKMLASREEPSPAFRADLRNRLLRQIAEKQPAAYPTAKREGFRERIASLFPPRTVLVAVTSTVLVVLLAFVGVVWYSGRYAGAPEQAAAPSAAEYSVRLPANIVPEGVTFTAKTSLSASPGQAAVYKIQSTDVTTESVTALGRKLGFSGQAGLTDDGTKIVMSTGQGEDMRQLTVWTASGAVEYGYVEPEKLYPTQPAELPSQGEAELIAYDFLQQADLLPSGYQSLAKIKDETTVIAGGGYSVSPRYATEAAPSAPSVPAAPTAPQAPTYWLVDFPYQIDGASATGPGSKIDVSIGDGGEVVKLVWSWRQMSPLGTDNIISEKQAYQDLIQGKGSLDVALDCRQVVVEQVQLKYWLDPPSEKQYYAAPVYEFTGQCLDKNGNHLEDFTGWTPALSTN